MGSKKKKKIDKYLCFENLAHGTSSENAQLINKSGYKISKKGLLGKGFYLWNEGKKNSKKLGLNWAYENHKNSTKISCLFYSLKVHENYFYDISVSEAQLYIDDILSTYLEEVDRAQSVRQENYTAQKILEISLKECEEAIAAIVELHFKQENLEIFVLSGEVPIRKNFHQTTKQAHCIVLRVEKKQVQANKSVINVKKSDKITTVSVKNYSKEFL